MARICSPYLPKTSLNLKGGDGFICYCTCAFVDNSNKKKKKKKIVIRNHSESTPMIVKLAVSGVTELLRLFTFNNRDKLDRLNINDVGEVSVSSVDDVVKILKFDYENAYFVTGVFTCATYAEDCLFEDPTIRFRGTELYSRNLKLLVPFFESPSIGLQNIEKGVDTNTNSIIATWKLRTYLKLPWRPLILIDGSTLYELDSKFKIVKHSESWSVTAVEAITQIFTPSFNNDGM